MTEDEAFELGREQFKIQKDTTLIDSSREGYVIIGSPKDILPESPAGWVYSSGWYESPEEDK
jgi:hypothetical protein